MPKAQLIELYARALGVIDEARIEFGPGFNVLTGETGAGKTLVLGALDLCLGGDAASSRHALSADTKTVAIFSRDHMADVQFSRETSPTGRLRASLDGVSSSAEVLRGAARSVVVIHGQHDSLALRSRHEVLRIIDTAGGVSTAELDEVRGEISRLTHQRDGVGGDAAGRDHDRDYLAFQLRELSDANLTDAGELEERLEELTRLSAFRDAQSDLLGVVDALDGDSDDAILTRLAQAIARLPRDAGVDDLRQELSTVLDSARAHVYELAARAQPEHIDPSRFEQLEARVALLQQISRKYGGSLARALEQRDLLLARIEELSDADGRLALIDRQLSELKEHEHQLAQRAREDRTRAAEGLTARVQRQLPRVALPHAALRFVVEGMDGSHAQALFTPNPGQPEGPLSALASGGELSRVLLALCLETAQADVVAVFDEVDAGVGGQVAQQIGECLRELGTSQQVIAVTHLASVAAKATHHFVIDKSVRGGLTSSQVRPVTGDERVREIARMLAGDDESGEAHALARRLLESVA